MAFTSGLGSVAWSSRQPAVQKWQRRRFVHRLRLFAGLLRAGRTGELIKLARLRAVLWHAGAALVHDREIVAARRPLQVAGPLVQARRLRVVLRHHVRILVHLTGKHARRWILHVASVLIEPRCAGFILLDAVAKRIGRGQSPAAVRRPGIALPLADRYVGARPRRGSNRDDARRWGGRLLVRRGAAPMARCT